MKVAIVGGAPSWVDAPFDDESYEIWVLGNQIDNYKGKRVTRIFEIHDDLSHHDGGDGRYAKLLVDIGIPMMVGDKFPIKSEHIKVFDRSLSPLGHYFTSSPSYMFCQALVEGYDHIELYGIDMDLDDHEYFMQRPCMEAWIGYARGKGVTVITPEDCPLGKSEYDEARYEKNGVFHEDEFTTIANRHKAKMDEIDGHIRTLEVRRASHDGARQAYEILSKFARAAKTGKKLKLTEKVLVQ